MAFDVNDLNETVWNALAFELELDGAGDLQGISSRLRSSLAGKLFNNFPKGSTNQSTMEKLIENPSFAIQREPALQALLVQNFRIPAENFAFLFKAPTKGQESTQSNEVVQKPKLVLRAKKKPKYSAEDWGIDLAEYFPDLWKALAEEYSFERGKSADTKADIYIWAAGEIAGKLRVSFSTGQTLLHTYALGGQISETYLIALYKVANLPTPRKQSPSAPQMDNRPDIAK